MLYGRVAVDGDHPALSDRPPYVEKYGPAVGRAFGDIARFSDCYPIALRVTVTGVRSLDTR